MIPNPLEWILNPVVSLLWLINLALLGMKLYAFVDAALRPAPYWPAAGVAWSKTVWLVILGLAVFFGGFGLLGLIGLVAVIVYLVDIRAKLRGVRGYGGGGYGTARGSSSDGPYGPYRR